MSEIRYQQDLVPAQAAFPLPKHLTPSELNFELHYYTCLQRWRYFTLPDTTSSIIITWIHSIATFPLTTRLVGGRQDSSLERSRVANYWMSVSSETGVGTPDHKYDHYVTKQWRAAVLMTRDIPDPWIGLGFDEIEEEWVTRHMYNPLKKCWKEDAIVVKVQSRVCTWWNL